MFNKKMYILILLIVSICAISTVSAADNATDAVAIDDANTSDTIANMDEDISKATADDAVAIENDENNEVLASEEESALSQDQSGDVLSGLPVKSYQYKVVILDGNEIQATKSGNLNYYLEPYNMFYMDNFNFKFDFWDYNAIFLSTPYIQNDQRSYAAGNYYITFDANTFRPGTYLAVAVNNADGGVMSYNALKVSGTAKITASDFSGVYNTGTMTAKATDTKGNPLTAMKIKVTFTNGQTTVTREYGTDANGQISFTPPVGVGTWTVTFSSALSHVTATAVTKTATIAKAPVTIQAYKVTGYNGYKTTIKAKVTSNGKNVNEGTVTFKINGKTYKAAVKDGIASVNVKLKKVKTYKYSASFQGSNYNTPKTSKSKAVVKKTYKTKITFKNRSIYVFKEKVAKIIVKTKTGKKVKNGKLKIVGAGQTRYVNVKNGVAKVIVKGLHITKHFVGFTKKGETYKKNIVQKFKVKYIPSSHKYKSSSKTIKITSKFKCAGCGKTQTHYHKARDSYGMPYRHTIAVI